MTASAVPQRTESVAGMAASADRLDVTALIHRLAAALDEHRFADVGELFTPDGSVRTPGGLAEGRPALVAQARRNHEQYLRLQHRMTGVLVDLDGDGDGADLRADTVVRFVGEGEVPVRTLGAVYRGRAVHTTEGWRLARLEVDPVWRIDAG